MAASGNGTALLQASVSYHVDEHKPTKPAYDFTVEVIETDGGSTLTIKLCSKYGEKFPPLFSFSFFCRYNLDKESGMVVVSGTLPSGFVADTDKLDEVRGLCPPPTPPPDASLGVLLAMGLTVVIRFRLSSSLRTLRLAFSDMKRMIIELSST